MLTRKAAVDSASKHLADLVPIQGSPVLEEHFFTDGVWQITLSYYPTAPAGHVNGAPPKRELKSFAIDGRSGEVLSMKIRAVKD